MVLNLNSDYGRLGVYVTDMSYSSSDGKRFWNDKICTVGKSNAVYRMDALFCMTNTVTGDSAAVFENSDGTYQVTGKDVDGKNYNVKVDINEIDPENCSLIELTALSTFLNKNSGIKSECFPGVTVGNVTGNSYFTKHNYIDIIQDNMNKALSQNNMKYYNQLSDKIDDYKNFKDNHSEATGNALIENETQAEQFVSSGFFAGIGMRSKILKNSMGQNGNAEFAGSNDKYYFDKKNNVILLSDLGDSMRAAENYGIDPEIARAGYAGSSFEICVPVSDGKSVVIDSSHFDDIECLLNVLGLVDYLKVVQAVNEAKDGLGKTENKADDEAVDTLMDIIDKHNANVKNGSKEQERSRKQKFVINPDGSKSLLIITTVNGNTFTRNIKLTKDNLELLHNEKNMANELMSML